jgi:hypothetical protein
VDKLLSWYDSHGSRHGRREERIEVEIGGGGKESCDKSCTGILQKPRQKNANFGEVLARFRARFLPAQKVQNLAQNLA